MYHHELKWGRYLFSKKNNTYKLPGLLEIPSKYPFHINISLTLKKNYVFCAPWHIPPYFYYYNHILYNNKLSLRINTNQYLKKHYLYENMNTFCVVRHPYTRLLSEYKMRQCGKLISQIFNNNYK